MLLPGLASAQLPVLPGSGSDNSKDKEGQVRLAADPREQIKRERERLVELQQTLIIKAQDAQTWARRQRELTTRRRALEKHLQSLSLRLPPPEDERRWIPPKPTSVDGIEVDPDDEPMLVDAAVPDAGVPDGGALDGGVLDGGMDAGVDALDGGLAGDAGDAGPPDAAPDMAVPDMAAPDAEMEQSEVILPIFPVGDDGYLPPATHPAEFEEVDRLIGMIKQLEQAYATMRRMQAEERTLITEGIQRADTLLRQLEVGEVEQIRLEEKPKAQPLKAVERLSLDVHLARIEVSLARARQRRESSADGEGEALVAPTLPDLPAMTVLEAAGVSPVEAFAPSYRKAVSSREEQEGYRREMLEQTTRMTSMFEPLRSLRERRRKLDLLMAERTLAQRERTFGTALDAMAFNQETIDYAKRFYTRSVALREKNIPKYEEQLDKLRKEVAPVPASDESSPFITARVLEMRRTLAAEHIFFERQKLLRDAFRNDLVTVLVAAERGQQPEKAFFSKYSGILTVGEMKQRSHDRETRCDGWRRAQNSAGSATPPADLLDNQKTVVTTYEKLADLCMREEWVHGSQSRLGEIGRFHLERLVWKTRSWFWYAWRGLISLFLLALTIYLTRIIRRLTHRMARPRDEDEPSVSGIGAGVQAENPVLTSGEMKARKLSPIKALVMDRVHRLRSGVALIAYLGGVAGLWLVMVVLTGRYLWDLPVEWGSLLGWSTYTIFVVGDDQEVSLWSLAQVAMWTLSAVYAGRLVQTFISDNLLEHFRVDRGLRDATGTISRYIIIVVGISVGLASVGIGLGALAVVFGVIGIGIGFGLQNIANNFISGFILLLERPIRKGDFVQVGDMIGEVKSISARATIIETRDAVTVIVPNSEFISDRVVNWTLGNGERVRAQVKVGVAYGSDVTLVRKLMLEVGRQHVGVLRTPRPWVEMQDFGDSSLDFILHVWTRRIRTLPGLQSDLRQNIDDVFREHGIEIPFPQRDLHIRSDFRADEQANNGDGSHEAGASDKDEGPKPAKA